MRTLRRHKDLLASVVIAAALAFFAGRHVANSFASAVYNMGISVLSIIFSVFFAALAVIMSAGNDDFVFYLRSRGTYDHMLWQFKFSLRLLFVSLLYSIVAYGYTAAISAADPAGDQSIIFFALFAFLFTYSLLAAYLAVGSAMRYSNTRLSYIESRKDNQDPPQS